MQGEQQSNKTMASDFKLQERKQQRKRKAQYRNQEILSTPFISLPELHPNIPFLVFYVLGSVLVF